MSTEELIKTVPLGVPIIAAVVETFLKPKLATILRDRKAEREMFDLIHNKFQNYLEGAVESHSYLKTVVFQNDRKLLADLYQPLTVTCAADVRKKIKSVLIDSYRVEFLPEHRRVLLIDDAGMGKSTVLRFLFLRCIEEQAGLPIFIELRHLKGTQSIVEYIHEQLTPISGEINLDSLRKLIELGDFVFFLDGYDEIPEAEREVVTKNLQDFVSKAGGNTFVLSSRQEPALVSFANFQGFSIRGLKLEEAYALIRKYGVQGGPAEELIAELERDKSSVEEFLGNPMLVSLLFKAFSYKAAVPLEKSAFYGQVYDALFEAHDYTKPLYRREKKSKLSRDKFEQVLRALGIVTLKKGVGYPKNQLLTDIDRAREMCPGLEFDSSDFLQDLLRHVPLFAAEGDYHRWKHKSLQEYFAARYICVDAKENQPALLRKMVQERSYFNVLDLCYDLDYHTFRNTVIYDLITDFLAFYDSSYTCIDRNLVPEAEVRRRKQVAFRRKDVVFPPTFFKAANAKESEIEVTADFENMLVFLRRQGNLLARKSSTVQRNGARKQGLIRCETAPLLLVPLLGNKQDACATLATQDKADDSWVWGNPKKRRKKSSEKPTEQLEQQPEPCTVTDDPESWVNDPERFYKVTNFISRQGSSDHLWVLDPDACRVIKAEIEVDLERTNNKDVVLGLL